MSGGPSRLRRIQNVVYKMAPPRTTNAWFAQKGIHCFSAHEGDKHEDNTNFAAGKATDVMTTTGESKVTHEVRTSVVSQDCIDRERKLEAVFG